MNIGWKYFHVQAFFSVSIFMILGVWICLSVTDQFLTSTPNDHILTQELRLPSETSSDSRPLVLIFFNSKCYQV